VAVFTNLSRDHPDYHGTMDAYLDAKLRLFDGRNGARRVKPWTAVINADDPVAPRVLSAAGQGGGTVWTFGADRSATFRLVHVAPRPDGVELRLAHEGVETTFTVPLLGRYNAWNAAAAFAAAHAIGVGPGTVARGLAACAAVPGRLEPVVLGQPFLVVVDYAHTPDALLRALAAVREHASGRVLLVFGAGGDRDAGKRPLMGHAAAEGVDRAGDERQSPRRGPGCDRARSRTARRRSARGRARPRTAIARAIAEARPGDVVLIAGKGHETTQTIGATVTPFDDRVVAGELLRAGGRHDRLEAPLLAAASRADGGGISSCARYRARPVRARRCSERHPRRQHRHAHARTGRVVRAAAGEPGRWPPVLSPKRSRAVRRSRCARARRTPKLAGQEPGAPCWSTT
jgi:UDP-N-acetylmuramoyl-L-alanyl-D-glutamate--2,6-diaminopimelate ligase